MATINQLLTNQGINIGSKTAPNSITPTHVADELEAITNEILVRGVQLLDLITDLGSLAGDDQRLYLVKDKGFYRYSATGPASGEEVVAGVGCFWVRFAALAGSDTWIKNQAAGAQAASGWISGTFQADGNITSGGVISGTRGILGAGADSGEALLVHGTARITGDTELNGRLGVKTDSPEFEIDINGELRCRPLLTYSGTTRTGRGITMRYDMVGAQDFAYMASYNWDTASFKEFRFDAANMLINPSHAGKVLIGTTVDTGQKLQVVGTVKITGASEITGSLTVGTIAALGSAASLFLTHTGGVFQSRAAAQVLSDIGGAPAFGSTAYIHNTTIQQASSNFNISGAGVVAGNFTAGGASGTIHQITSGTQLAFYANGISTILGSTAQIYFRIGSADLVSILASGIGSNISTMTLDGTTGSGIRLRTGGANDAYLYAIGGTMYRQAVTSLLDKIGSTTVGTWSSTGLSVTGQLIVNYTSGMVASNFVLNGDVGSGRATVIDFQRSGVTKAVIGTSANTDQLIVGDLAGDFVVRTISGQKILFSTTAGASSQLVINSTGLSVTGTATVSGVINANGDIMMGGTKSIFFYTSTNSDSRSLRLSGSGTNGNHAEVVGLNNLQLRTQSGVLVFGNYNYGTDARVDYGTWSAAGLSVAGTGDFSNTVTISKSSGYEGLRLKSTWSDPLYIVFEGNGALTRGFIGFGTQVLSVASTQDMVLRSELSGYLASGNNQILKWLSTGVSVTGNITATNTGAAAQLTAASSTTAYSQLDFYQVGVQKAFVGYGGATAAVQYQNVLYHNVATGSTHGFYVNSSQVVSISSTGLSVTGTLNTTGTITSTMAAAASIGLNVERNTSAYFRVNGAGTVYGSISGSTWNINAGSIYGAMRVFIAGDAAGGLALMGNYPNTNLILNADGTSLFNYSVSVTGNITASGKLMLGSGADSGDMLQVRGTAALLGSLTASGAIIKALYIGSTLLAAANGDTLVGLEIAPTFTPGAFTGVKKRALRVTGATELAGSVYRKKTAPGDTAYTVDENDYFLYLGTITAARVLTLPAAADHTNRELEIFNANGSAFAWSFAAAITYPDGSTSSAITNGTSFRIYSDGTNWLRVG